MHCIKIWVQAMKTEKFWRDYKFWFKISFAYFVGVVAYMYFNYSADLFRSIDFLVFIPLYALLVTGLYFFDKSSGSETDTMQYTVKFILPGVTAAIIIIYLIIHAIKGY